jgi:hypothetical protein
MAQAAIPGAGCAGWVVAAAFGAIVIGQCTSKTTPPSSETSSASTPSTSRYVGARSLNCRSSSAPSAKVVRALARDQLVTVSEEGGGWSRISGSPDCWVKASFLSAEPRATTRSTGSGGYTGSTPTSLSSQPSRSRSSSFYGGQSTPKRAKKRSRPRGSYDNEGCPCSGRQVCIGPRGGRYCITSGGNKRYGV